MRTFRTLVAMAAVTAVGLLAPVKAFSQGPEKPVAVVSIAPIERLMQDFTYLMRTCGVPQVGGIGSMMVKQYTQGLDTKRAAGVAIQIVNGQPVAMGFLPLSSREQFFSALAGAGQIPDDLGKGMFAFDLGGRTVYAKEQGQWLFIGQQEDDLKSPPADPSTMLGDSPTKYDLAMRINVQALPAEMKEMAVGQLRAGYERQLAQEQGQTADEKAAAEQMGKASIEQIERMLKETDQVLWGLSASAAAQKVQVDVGATFVAGSELAAQMEKQNGVTSDFTGLLIQGAAMTTRMTSLIGDADKVVAKGNLKSFLAQIEKPIEASGDLPSASKEALKKFLRGAVGVLEKTIDAGKFDGGGAVALTDGKVRGVFGGTVADGMQIEKDVKELVASLGSGPDVPKFQFNYAKHQNVNLHKVSIPIKSDDPKVRKVLGTELKLVIGTGEKSLYLSIDPDGDSVIKSALDRVNSTKSVKVTPVETILEVGQILAFVQTINSNPVLEMAAQSMQASEGKDKVRVVANVIPRGAVYQMTIEEGVLKGIGAAVQASQGGGPGF